MIHVGSHDQMSKRSYIADFPVQPLLGIDEFLGWR
jgi:hypothetical protein